MLNGHGLWSMTSRRLSTEEEYAGAIAEYDEAAATRDMARPIRRARMSADARAFGNPSMESMRNGAMGGGMMGGAGTDGAESDGAQDSLRFEAVAPETSLGFQPIPTNGASEIPLPAQYAELIRQFGEDDPRVKVIEEATWFALNENERPRRFQYFMSPQADEVAQTSPAIADDTAKEDFIRQLRSSVSTQPRKSNEAPADALATTEQGRERGGWRYRGSYGRASGDGVAKKPINAPRPKTWRRVKAIPNTTRLMIGDREELDLNGMQVHVQVDGFRARVLVDYFYYNDRDRQLEGKFKLRLPDDASLYYFAFGQSAFDLTSNGEVPNRGFLETNDETQFVSLRAGDIKADRESMWRNVKEARMVPREKAAYAYGQTVRRRVDPALVEWSGAGVFNANVFPLMPKKLHRIVIGYDVNLTRTDDGLAYSLDLPEEPGKCKVELNVRDTPGTTGALFGQLEGKREAGRQGSSLPHQQAGTGRVNQADDCW